LTGVYKRGGASGRIAAADEIKQNRGEIMPDFYMPRRRWELLSWFKDCRPSWKVSRWPLAQLKAVYIKERLRHG